MCGRSRSLRELEGILFLSGDVKIQILSVVEDKIDLAVAFDGESVPYPIRS